MPSSEAPIITVSLVLKNFLLPTFYGMAGQTEQSSPQARRVEEHVRTLDSESLGAGRARTQGNLAGSQAIEQIWETSKGQAF
jgi:hypothetical protein